MKSAIKQTFVLSLIFSLALILTESIFYGQNPTGHPLTYESGIVDNQGFQDDDSVGSPAIDLLIPDEKETIPLIVGIAAIVPAASPSIKSNFALSIWQPPKTV